jgi:hypothetical protein
MILIQSPDSAEKCLVASMEGYDGWTVLQDPAEPPAPFHYWDEETDTWKLDEEAHDRAELLAIARDPEQLAGLLASILARLPTETE